MSDYCPNCESSAKRIAELDAENERLRRRLAFEEGSSIKDAILEAEGGAVSPSNHFEGCWRIMSHHACTLARVAELEAENSALRWQERAPGTPTYDELEAQRDRALNLAEQAQSQAVRAADVADTLKAELAALKGRRCEACRFDHCEIYRAARWPREREDFGCAAWTERGTE